MTTFAGKTSTAEAVVNHIKQQLADGTLKLGDQLPGERSLQEQFGISRFSLREGLARLSALGIVRVVHGKGAFITDGSSSTGIHDAMLPWFAGADARQVGELIEARIAIERAVASLAAQRRTPGGVKSLRRTIDQAASAIESPETFGLLDHEFHVCIAKIAENKFFEKMLGIMHDHMRVFLLVHAQTTAARRKALNEHTGIALAIESGDQDSIGALVERHIVGCKKDYDATTRTARN